MKTLLTAILSVAAFATAYAGPGDNLGIRPVSAWTGLTTTEQSSLLIPYQPTAANTLPRILREPSANGLTADFSVQDSASQTAVWSENFAGDLSKWTQNNGVDGVITFEIKDSTYRYFPKTGAPSATAVHIDGPYQVYKRSIGHITSEEITVPSNGEFHSYICTDPSWNEYSSLHVYVSSDNYTNDSTELWNSDMVSGDKRWVKVDASLASYTGKKVRIRMTYSYGSNDKTFKMGGYLGDYYAANLSVSGVKTIGQITVKTGDEVHFADLSAGNPKSWNWSFTGGEPATSNEQAPTVVYTRAGNYDVSLTVTDSTGNSNTVTKKAFVHVDGQIPTAAVAYPAEFRDLTTRTRMIAPLVPVTYKDQSAGYPTSYSWAIYSQYDIANNKSLIFQPDTIYKTEDVTMEHDRLNKWYVTHIAQNDSGYTYSDDSVQVQFQGLITNFRPGDKYQTNFTDGNTTFPGANNMGITAWAERFSKPSHPMLLDAVYVNFTKASAENIADQIANVSFSLYTSENGVPGKQVDLLDSWTITELGCAIRNNSGVVQLQLNRKYVINDEFFIVISGIPTKNDSLECAFAMAPMRSEGNTAFMLNKGTWRPLTGYFQAAPGGQTSLAVFPHVRHSVMLPAKISSEGAVTRDMDSLVVNQKGGNAEKVIFSYLGWEKAEVNSSWCRLASTPGEYQADTLKFNVDALPEGVDSREAIVSVTDSVDTLQLRIIQKAGAVTGIDKIDAGTISSKTEVYDLSGRRVNPVNLPKGIYIIRENGKSRKVTL